MKCEIREICGDYALDIVAGKNEKVTIYFNSRQNALNVKRILEVDDSIPNAATVCDMQEVVRCKDCKYYYRKDMCGGTGWCTAVDVSSFDKHFCSYGEKREEK